MFERDAALKILSVEQEETIHEQAMRILEEIGTDVLHAARARAPSPAPGRRSTGTGCGGTAGS